MDDLGTRAEVTSELKRRLRPLPQGPLDVRTDLRHFLMVSHIVETENLARHLPSRYFEPVVFDFGGRKGSLVSAVFFVDDDFHFVSCPFPKFRFPQTNYRAYVRRKDTGQHCAWFFGTTLGAWPVHVARWSWGIPWHPARYRVVPESSEESLEYRVESEWSPALVKAVNTGEDFDSAPGFPTRRHLDLILTHPVDGYFRRRDGKLGTYAIWHKLIRLKRCQPLEVKIPLYERLGLLGVDDVARPHSIAYCPRVHFHILMPPVEWKNATPPRSETRSGIRSGRMGAR